MKHNALYITATRPATGKSAIALGTMQMLSRSMGKVAVFRPIINEPQLEGKDPDINLMLEYFKLDQSYKDTFAYTHKEAQEIINQASINLLLENIIQKFKELEKAYDFVLCIGTDFLGKDPVFEFDLNANIASNLACPVMLVTNGDDAGYLDMADSLQLIMESLSPYGLDVIATIVNRSNLTPTELDQLRHVLRRYYDDSLIYAIPSDPVLGRATMNDVMRGLKASVIQGGDLMDTPVGDYIVAAMHVDNFINYIAKDQLVITPGDRTDILLAALASKHSVSMPNISGVLLTGGLRPPESVMKLIDGWSDTPLPILLTESHTYPTVTALQEIYGLIEPGDTRKINTVLGLYEHHVNSNEIAKRLLAESKINRMTPMMFEFELIERAKSDKQRIVLAEGEEDRILRATDILLRREVAEIYLLGNPDVIARHARDLNLDIKDAVIIDPARSPKFQDYVKAYYEFRKAKGMTMEKAEDIMADPTYFGTMMVKMNDADGMVSGSINTTAHTIRPAFEFIKTKPGFSVVSSVFLMCLKDRVLVFGDCAVNPNPTAQQLAEIAVASAHTAKVFGIEPRVAMLSYSTGSSGKGADVDVVIEATRIAKEMAPDLALEGPLQYDAAIDPIVASTKLPGSQVAGRATVFIFPDLNTGNNTYKAVQRAAGAVAIGPVLQGLLKPVNDLSRGCLVPDIVNTVAITAIQAAADKKK